MIRRGFPFRRKLAKQNKTRQAVPLGHMNFRRNLARENWNWHIGQTDFRLAHLRVMGGGSSVQVPSFAEINRALSRADTLTIPELQNLSGKISKALQEGSLMGEQEQAKYEVETEYKYRVDGRGNKTLLSSREVGRRYVGSTSIPKRVALSHQNRTDLEGARQVVQLLISVAEARAAIAESSYGGNYFVPSEAAALALAELLSPIGKYVIHEARTGRLLPGGRPFSPAALAELGAAYQRQHPDLLRHVHPLGANGNPMPNPLKPNENLHISILV
jgi:hypothetical protein